MSINFATATREEIEEYAKSLETKLNSNKRTNKTTKLVEELDLLFSIKFGENADDSFLKLHFLLSLLYSTLEISASELLDELEEPVEDEDLKKVIKVNINKLTKTDEFKLRRTKKNTPEVKEETVVSDSPL